MSWDAFTVGQKQRPIKISNLLNYGVYRFCRDTKRPRSSIFDMALIKLWKIYNGGGTSNVPLNEESMDIVSNILLDNPMPGKISRSETHYIYASFRGEKTFNFASEILRNYGADSMNDLIRRVVTWFLNEKGYLHSPKEEEGLP
ncbi:MAG: hypothetical protein DRO67_05245 [Candidatus Asgardarchaeum californiense]|nr:MAG: hypothetical protein DRO67_05245 [Candidatus Asgardarchaeum californiense]